MAYDTLRLAKGLSELSRELLVDAVDELKLLIDFHRCMKEMEVCAQRLRCRRNSFSRRMPKALIGHILTFVDFETRLVVKRVNHLWKDGNVHQAIDWHPQLNMQDIFEWTKVEERVLEEFCFLEKMRGDTILQTPPQCLWREMKWNSNETLIEWNDQWFVTSREFDENKVGDQGSWRIYKSNGQFHYEVKEHEYTIRCALDGNTLYWIEGWEFVKGPNDEDDLNGSIDDLQDEYECVAFDLETLETKSRQQLERPMSTLVKELKVWQVRGNYIYGSWYKEDHEVITIWSKSSGILVHILRMSGHVWNVTAEQRLIARQMDGMCGFEWQLGQQVQQINHPSLNRSVCGLQPLAYYTEFPLTYHRYQNNRLPQT